MAERIIWTDRSGVRVDGGEPNTTRYVRCDVYEIMAEAIYQIGINDVADPKEIALTAMRKANALR